jgi:hypothetical protein
MDNLRKYLMDHHILAFYQLLQDRNIQTIKTGKPATKPGI